MASITAEMFSTGKYSDLLIKCQGRAFKVHRTVVCLQSKPLAAAIDGKFMEAFSGEIDLDGNEPDIVYCMLKFMYESNHSDGRDSDTTSSTQSPAKKAEATGSSLTFAADTSTTKCLLLTNTKVYIIGDQLQIPDLKTLAKKKYEEVMLAAWDSVSFAANLKLLYEESMENDRSLKDVAIHTAGDHAKELCDRGEFATLCRENGEIAFDILKASLTADPLVKTCPFRHQSNYVQHHCRGLTYCQSCGNYFN
ncbi:hypothetical protein ONS95_012131 [Cadophora gregata]|uniref:uncharacterized protein n=1 Tax=Cadophora gregata TaxID=51156 RepID=UPI0026DB36C1|nr:uncharacterized protein ONS95_012131 [Cadophora gregata]KAK0117806.1 hypothetical protein ONS95_012131 [Cadophora gregata]KAK0122860.1 hypothetical protein ONS96_009887 [Cadophora gregata f. sp. sojae]